MIFLDILMYKSGGTSGGTQILTKNEAKKVNKNNALVAQLDRALDYESRGQGFESSRAHQFFLFNIKQLKEKKTNAPQTILSFDTDLTQ